MDNLNVLRSFLSVYRTGSVTRAAERVNLTQPAVTKHLRLLEARLGHALFTRVGRGVAPTPAAHELARRVEAHLDALDAWSDGFKLGNADLGGTVYLGGPAEFLSVLALPALARVHERGVALRCVIGAPEALLADVRAGALDLMVATVRLSGPDVTSTPLYREELVLVGAPSWRAPGRGDTFDPAGWSTVPLLAYAEDLPLVRRFWRQVFGTPPALKASTVLPDLRGLIRAAIHGAGVTVVPRYLVEDALSDGDLVDLVRPARPPSNQLFLLWRSSNALPPRVDHVRTTLSRAWAQPAEDAGPDPDPSTAPARSVRTRS